MPSLKQPYASLQQSACLLWSLSGSPNAFLQPQLRALQEPAAGCEPTGRSVGALGPCRALWKTKVLGKVVQNPRAWSRASWHQGESLHGPAWPCTPGAIQVPVGHLCGNNLLVGRRQTETNSLSGSLSVCDSTFWMAVPSLSMDKRNTLTLAAIWFPIQQMESSIFKYNNILSEKGEIA